MHVVKLIYLISRVFLLTLHTFLIILCVQLEKSSTKISIYLSNTYIVLAFNSQNRRTELKNLTWFYHYRKASALSTSIVWEIVKLTAIEHVINCDAIIDSRPLHLDSCPDSSHHLTRKKAYFVTYYVWFSIQALSNSWKMSKNYSYSPRLI